jgi:GLPGLI family protein
LRELKNESSPQIFIKISLRLMVKLRFSEKCKKATFHNEETKQDIVAWYTDALVCSSGPQNFWGLPGMILGIDINDGLQIITAQKNYTYGRCQRPKSTIRRKENNCQRI